MNWAPEHDAKAIALVADGLSAAQISDALWKEFRTTYSRCAVLGRLHRIGARHGIERKPVEPKPKSIALKPVKRKKGPIYLTRSHSARPRAVPVMPIPEAPVIAEFLSVPFTELKEGQCRFLHGEGPFLACGQPQEQHSSYCRHHDRICHTAYKPLNISDDERERRVAWARVLNETRRSRVA